MLSTASVRPLIEPSIRLVVHSSCASFCCRNSNTGDGDKTPEPSQLGPPTQADDSQTDALPETLDKISEANAVPSDNPDGELGPQAESMPLPDIHPITSALSLQASTSLGKTAICSIADKHCAK